LLRHYGHWPPRHIITHCRLRIGLLRHIALVIGVIGIRLRWPLIIRRLPHVGCTLFTGCYRHHTINIGIWSLLVINIATLVTLIFFITPYFIYYATLIHTYLRILAVTSRVGMSLLALVGIVGIAIRHFTFGHTPLITIIRHCCHVTGIRCWRSTGYHWLHYILIRLRWSRRPLVLAGWRRLALVGCIGYIGATPLLIRHAIVTHWRHWLAVIAAVATPAGWHYVIATLHLQ